MIKKFISGIIIIIIGMIIFNFGLNVNQAIIKHYNCIPCSVFQEECPFGYDSKENNQCHDSLEYPFKFTFGLAMLGIVLAIMPIIDLIHEIIIFKKSSHPLHKV
jgi:hypothetical protein